MTEKPTHPLLRHIRRLTRAKELADLSDRECLERFVTLRDEDAFAALVRRHGALVRGVCHRLLHHREDAEDVFQATFLVLARKAGSVRWKSSIAPWLYHVAYRLARKARVTSSAANALFR